MSSDKDFDKECLVLVIGNVFYWRIKTDRPKFLSLFQFKIQWIGRIALSLETANWISKQKNDIFIYHFKKAKWNAVNCDHLCK